MERVNITVDLSERAIALAGQAFSNVYDRMNREEIRDHHIAGILLIDELRRLGMSITHPRPLLVIPTLPVINAPAHARSLWEEPDLEQTLEMVAPLHLLEGGA